jgi:hypothetical protein
MKDLTTEQIEKSVLASYDSITLIHQLSSKDEVTTEDLESIERNKQHISIMLEKDWFVTALSNAQKLELEEVIK